MSALPHNIERAACSKGEYVGYSNGCQRIRKCARGWETYALGSSVGVPLYLTGRTLEELGKKLENYNR